MKSFRVALLASATFALACPALSAPIPLKARWAPAASTGVPLLGPDLSWTGTPQSTPTDPTLTTAKPNVLWQKPSDVRLVTNKRLCVDADAVRGMAGVEIGNGSTAVSAVYVNNTYVNARGGTDVVPGWCVDVNAAAFRAISTSGSQNFWARGTASDGTMQQRVIGGPLIQAGGYDTGQRGGNYIMTMYPRTTENDTSVTVCPSSCTYTTIQAAFDALRVTSFEAPLITINTSGTYTLANASGLERSTGQRAVLTVAPGVTAVIAKPSITFNDSSTWNIALGWDGVEFRGNPTGLLTVDMQWMVNFIFGTKPAWFNGINFTNTCCGTVYTTYWNGSPNPFGGSNTRAYVDDIVTQYTGGQMIDALYAINNTALDTLGAVFNNAAYSYGNIIQRYDNSQYTPINALTIRYTPPGAQTTATVEKVGGDGAGTSTVAKVNGSTVCTVPNGYYSSDTNPTYSSWVTAFNAACPNFVATITDSARNNVRASSVGGANGIASTNVFNVTAPFVVGIDIHAEAWHTYTGFGTPAPNNLRQNYTVRNNRILAYANAPFFNNDADFFNGLIIKGNVWLSNGNTNPLQLNGNWMKHVVYDYNTQDGRILRNEIVGGVNQTGSDYVYSEFSNNAGPGPQVTGDTTSHGTCFFYSSGWVNNYYTPDASQGLGSCVLNGPRDSGNVSYSPNTFASRFVDVSTGDVRPSAATIADTQFPRIAPYDGRVLPFATTDVAGAWSKNDPAP